MMTMLKNRSGGALHVIIISVFVVVALGVLGYVLWQNFFAGGMNTATPLQPTQETTPAQVLMTASDKTLGSGFTLLYPETWTNVHVGATQPQSTGELQEDVNTITSPTGTIHVVLSVSTNTQIGGTCDNSFIKLKYLATDTTPNFPDGRFAAYVVYYPNSNTRQYHIGLQKNTDAIKGVTLESNTACNFFYSEFIQRQSSIEGVPNSFTIISIQFDELAAGNNLKSGVTEAEVAAKLSGEEYEQAKAIVQSVRVE